VKKYLGARKDKMVEKEIILIFHTKGFWMGHNILVGAAA